MEIAGRAQLAKDGSVGGDKDGDGGGSSSNDDAIGNLNVLSEGW